MIFVFCLRDVKNYNNKKQTKPERFILHLAIIPNIIYKNKLYVLKYKQLYFWNINYMLLKQTKNRIMFIKAVLCFRSYYEVNKILNAYLAQQYIFLCFISVVISRKCSLIGAWNFRTFSIPRKTGNENAVLGKYFTKNIQIRLFSKVFFVEDK